MSELKTFKVVTLGCRTNQYESQGYADQMRKLGFASAREGEEADWVIVNTCTVTESADSASRHQIRSLLKNHPHARFAVTGCMAESAPEAIRSIDPRIMVVPNPQKENLLEHFFPERDDLPEFQIQSFDAHTRAFVKVQDGCNSFCTYCVIPYVRGRSRSRPIAEVIGEVETLVAHGYKEVVLTGINVGDFDGGGMLSDLIRAVDQVKGLRRLRVSSIDPDEVDHELASAVLEGKTTAPSMHIVLQSGSNVVLKRMNRKYTRQNFIETVQKMKRKNPDFTVTTDIIVGFPGETESDFEETLEMVSAMEFAKVHMFPYSPRKRTRASLYPNQVSSDVIRKRKEKLLCFAEQTSFALRNRFLGRRMEVLLESDEQDGMISGHTGNFLSVSIPKAGHRPNDLVWVDLIENTPEGLIGRTC